MRSSKQRSRGKNNRNRSPGNNINRVFDSSGPEGKVRGTPQQIIDKYQMLTRDAQLGNDRVGAENFQQHAEHYVRLLGDAQREAEAKRLEQEAQQRERQAQRDARNESRNENRNDRRNDQRNDNRNDPRNDNRTDPRGDTQSGAADIIDPSDAPQPELPSFITSDPTGTEQQAPAADKKPARKPRRKPAAKKAEAPDVAKEAPDTETPATPESPEAAE